MNILVTGGAGFIGSHIVDALVAREHRVIVLDNFSSGVKKNLTEKSVAYEGSVCDKDMLEKIFNTEKIDAIFHLAAQMDVRKSVEDPVHDANINVVGTLGLLECARKFKTKKIIFSSTGGAIYGDHEIIPTPETATPQPVSPYGCAKLAIEQYLHYYHVIHGLNYTALRYANVYGPRQNPHGEAGVVAIFLEKMLNGKKPTIYGGLQTRDYIYVEDVVQANLLALKDQSSNSYNVGTGKETSVDTLAKQLNELFDGKIDFAREAKRAGEQERSCLNFHKIQNALGWKPTISLSEGLEKTHEWFKNKTN